MVTLIIPVMRKPSLDTAIQYYLSSNTDCISFITIVDFDISHASSQRTLSLIAGFPHTYISVRNETLFNKSKALNIGIHISPPGTLLVCDADVLVASSTLLQWKSSHHARRCWNLDHVIETESGHKRPAPGIVWAEKNVFLELKGYSSMFQGWGKEDRDFLNRATLTGIEVLQEGHGLHLSHNDRDRTANYHMSDIAMMRAYNQTILDKRRLLRERFGSLQFDIQSSWEVVSNVATTS